eukprot:TRINITY_DN2448_c0_g2_i11.p4 TRINITY_DN2448_c0_g2~~TRINITY_DN2448_c0_g2_i11.p4  ORF type:complete len:193 (-),score=-22.37 TRINITY_DN2448_c0_g2_i11:1241-1819(-)
MIQFSSTKTPYKPKIYIKQEVQPAQHIMIKLYLRVRLQELGHNKIIQLYLIQGLNSKVHILSMKYNNDHVNKVMHITLFCCKIAKPIYIYDQNDFQPFKQTTGLFYQRINSYLLLLLREYTTNVSRQCRFFRNLHISLSKSKQFQLSICVYACMQRNRNQQEYSHTLCAHLQKVYDNGLKNNLTNQKKLTTF